MSFKQLSAQKSQISGSVLQYVNSMSLVYVQISAVKIGTLTHVINVFILTC